jgi:hypothetical protein
MSLLNKSPSVQTSQPDRLLLVSRPDYTSARERPTGLTMQDLEPTRHAGSTHPERIGGGYNYGADARVSEKLLSGAKAAVSYHPRGWQR